MLAGIGIAAACPAMAQRSLPSRQELDPARSAPVPAAPRGDLFRDVKPAPCAFRDTNATLRLKSVEFRGATDNRLALPPEALAASYADLLDRDVPASAICDIRDRATTLYLRHGILANVVIPEQRITDGALVLRVIEARIAAVTYHGDVGPAQRQVKRYLEKLRGMAPFDIDVAERYLLLASDIPGVSVGAVLQPSTAGPGSIDLDITLSRKAVGGTLMTQNYGSTTVGRDLNLARVDFNSFTGLGEQTSIIGYGTLASNEQRVLQATERFKLGSNGLSADFSGAWAWTRPGGALKPLDLDGTSFAGSARLTYPLVRQRRKNLNIGFGLDWIDQRVDFGGGIATLTNDKLRVLFARLDGQVSPQSLQSHSVALTGSLELRHGVRGLGASRYGDQDASRFGGKPDATVIRVEGQAAGRIAGPFVGKLAVSGQYTDDPLLSYEEYSAGTLSIGRGYDPAIASGDRTIAVSYELSTVPIMLLKGGANLRPYAFYDAARLTNIGAGAGTQILRSAGLGLRGQIAGLIAFDVAWAKPLDDPFAAGSAPGRFLFQLTLIR
jgi:hemolysin activation/secretion protein